MQLEKRFLPGELRVADTDHPMIVGYAAVFNAESNNLGAGFVEVIRPGAFKDTLRDCDCRALIDHDSSRILGRNKAGTLRLQEDEHGLRCEIDPPDTSYARDLIVSLRRGDLTGMSFGFNCEDDEFSFTDEFTLRTLNKVSLFDVSVVTYPAYEQTSVSLRSFDRWRETLTDPSLEWYRRKLRLAEMQRR